MGVGAALSQRVAADQKLHPCVFFSRRLTQAERNYVWHWHWQRGTFCDQASLGAVATLARGDEAVVSGMDRSQEPGIYSGHQTSKLPAGSLVAFPHPIQLHLLVSARVPQCQADALSRHFPEEEGNSASPDTILPPSRLVATLTVEERVKAAIQYHPGPISCPPNRLFVPPDLRFEVLQWAHSSHLTCHPGILRTKEVGVLPTCSTASYGPIGLLEGYNTWCSTMSIWTNPPRPAVFPSLRDGLLDHLLCSTCLTTSTKPSSAPGTPPLMSMTRSWEPKMKGWRSLTNISSAGEKNNSNLNEREGRTSHIRISLSMFWILLFQILCIVFISIFLLFL